MNTPVIEPTDERKAVVTRASAHWAGSPPLPDDALDPTLATSADLVILSAEGDILHLDFKASDDFRRFALHEVQRALHALDRHPGNPDLTCNLANAYRLAFEPQRAVNLLTPLFATHPSRSLRLALARALAQCKRLEEAERLLDPLTSGHLDDAEVLFEYATILLRLHRWEHSLRFFEAALALDPENVQGANNLGIIQRSLKHTGPAIRSFRRAVRCHPRFAVAHNNIGICHLKQERYDKAIDRFQTAIALLPSYRGAHLNLVVALIAAKRLDEASHHTKRAIRTFPDEPIFVDLLCDELYEQRRFDDVSKRFKYAISRFGMDYRRLNNLGVTEFHIGRQREAEDLFRLAIEQSEPDHHAFANLCWLFVRQHRFDEAVAMSLESARRLPDDSSLEPRLARLVAYAELGNYELAATEIENVLQRSNQPPRMFVVLSSVLLEDFGQPDRAIQVLRQGLELHPSDPGILNNLAYALVMSDRLPEASEVLSRAQNLVGVSPYVTATLGLYHLRRGHSARGLKLYNQAVSLAQGAQKKRVKQKLHLELGKEHLREHAGRGAAIEFKRAVELDADRAFTRQARSLLIEARKVEQEQRFRH